MSNIALLTRTYPNDANRVLEHAKEVRYAFLYFMSPIHDRYEPLTHSNIHDLDVRQTTIVAGRFNEVNLTIDDIYVDTKDADRLLKKFPKQENEKPMHHSKEKSMLIMLAVMARELGYEPKNNRNELTGEKSKSLRARIQHYGLDLDNGTILEHIHEAMVFCKFQSDNDADSRT